MVDFIYYVMWRSPYHCYLVKRIQSTSRKAPSCILVGRQLKNPTFAPIHLPSFTRKGSPACLNFFPSRLYSNCACALMLLPVPLLFTFIRTRMEPVACRGCGTSSTVFFFVYGLSICFKSIVHSMMVSSALPLIASRHTTYLITQPSFVDMNFRAA